MMLTTYKPQAKGYRSAVKAERPDYRESLLVKDVISTVAEPAPSSHPVISYTNRYGMQVAIVYLSDLCEIE